MFQIADYEDTNLVLRVSFGDFCFSSVNLFVAFCDLKAQLAMQCGKAIIEPVYRNREHTVHPNDLILSSVETLNKEPSDSTSMVITNVKYFR